MLEKRADHLERRIAAAGPDKNRFWDNSELSALRWALDLIRPQFAAVLEHPTVQAAQLARLVESAKPRRKHCNTCSCADVANVEPERRDAC